MIPVASGAVSSSPRSKRRIGTYASQDKTDCETDRKVPDRHDGNDDPDGAVLECRDSTVRVPEGFFYEVEAEDEDERRNNANRQVANHRRTRQQYAEGAEREHEARDASRASVLVEKERVDLRTSRQ